MTAQLPSIWKRALVACAIGLSALGLLAVPTLWTSQAIAKPRGVRPPAGAREPGRVGNLLSALSQTAAVVEGTVQSIDYEYSEEDGPQTVITLTAVKAHVGTASETLQIRQYGGPCPDGGYRTVSEQAQFLRGETYVVFLRNTSWTFSPVLASLSFRVADLDGSEALVDTDGRVIERLDDSGIVVSSPVFEPALDDGPLPQRLKAPARPVRPIDRSGFVAELSDNIRARGLQITGAFYDMPKATADWRVGPASPGPFAPTERSPSTHDVPIPDNPPSFVLGIGSASEGNTP